MGSRDSFAATRDPFLIKDVPCRKLFTFKNKYHLYLKERETTIKIIYIAKYYVILLNKAISNLEI